MRCWPPRDLLSSLNKSAGTWSAWLRQPFSGRNFDGPFNRRGHGRKTKAVAATLWLMFLLISLIWFPKQMNFYDDCSFSIPQREFAINSNSVAQPQINQCKIQTHSETKPIPDSIRCQIKLSVQCGWGPGYSIFIVCQFSWNRINQMPSDILRLIINSAWIPIKISTQRLDNRKRVVTEQQRDILMAIQSLTYFLGHNILLFNGDGLSWR